MVIIMKGFGLALGGGGTKGAYHMGVWRALSDMGIEISAVCGTSIGSINGAAIAQGDAAEAYKLWRSISLDNVVEISDIKNIGSNLFDAKGLMSVMSSVYKNNGLETEPLKKLLEGIIDEEKLRNSPVEFGLVTYSLETFEAVELFKEDIPNGKLIEYIMASASLPGMKRTVIDDKKYLDGGFADNIPANMLIRRGITDIITVDVGGVGIVKGVPETGINHIQIKCSENVIGHMDFNPESIDKMMKLGYYDCLKVFERTAGNYYSFNISDWHRTRLHYSADIISGIEKAARIYGIDRLKIYKLEALAEGVMRAYRKNCETYLSENQSFGMDSLRPDERQILTRLAANIISGKSDPGAVRFFSGVMGEIVLAANAVAYFAGKE